MVGKGQPPKAPEDKRKKQDVSISPKERVILEDARKIESPQKRFGTYIREAALDHAKQVIEENKSKK